MKTTTLRKPTTINPALTAISNRASKTNKKWSTCVVHVVAGKRNPLTDLHRVDVCEYSDLYRGIVAKTIWRGPVAVGVDAAGVAAWEAVFERKTTA